MAKRNNPFNDDDLIHGEVADALLETMNEEVVKLEDEIYELKQQLAEKDKEIEKYANDLSIALSEQSDMAWKWTQSEKQLRHQVCEEIREKFANWYEKEQTPNVRYWWSIMEILDQIEGENQ